MDEAVTDAVSASFQAAIEDERQLERRPKLSLLSSGSSIKNVLKTYVWLQPPSLVSAFDIILRNNRWNHSDDITPSLRMSGFVRNPKK